MILNTNCSETVYKLEAKSLSDKINRVKKIILNKKLVVEIGELKVISPHKYFSNSHHNKPSEFENNAVLNMDSTTRKLIGVDEDTILIEEINREMRKIIPADKYYEGMLEPSGWDKQFGTCDLSEARKKIADLFEQLVLLGEKYKKIILKKGWSFYVILDVRWYPMDYIADSNISMLYGDEICKDWIVHLDFENRGDIQEIGYDEVKAAVKVFKKEKIKIKYDSSS